jgi:CheY-like chemotaxis protein
MRNIIEGALRQADPDMDEAFHAAGGGEALAVLDRCTVEHQLIDLILCDLHMPKMNGLAFLQEKCRRNLAPGVPVVMVTADDCDPQLLEALSVGALGVLSKPFTQNQIQTCVASFILADCAPSGREGFQGNGR